MKWKFLIVSVFLMSSVILAAFYPKADTQLKETMILDAVLNYMEVLHFKPVQIDDRFSGEAFDLYLDMIDPGKRFLLQSEVDELSIYRNEIDDQALTKDFTFFNASVELLESARLRAERLFDEIMDEGLKDSDPQSFIELDGEKRRFAENEGELKSFWREYLIYDMNSRLNNKVEAQENTESQESENDADAEPGEIKSFNELRKEAVEDVNESFEDWFERLGKVRRSDRFETYVNTITHMFDPHSDYFNPKAKQDFDIRMGGKLEGIGARLQTDGDLTKVVSIVPGGPAWKGKKLEVDDKIMKVTQKGEEPVDIQGMRLDDVVSIIRGKKGTVVILTVKKTDGSIQDIQIERDEVIIDEGFARSLILDIPDAIEKVGYIRLPRFYSSFEGKDGNSCAKDVADEINKLNAQNVSGIILDLRNNGGGSLQDVVDMSGLFFEDGPVVQVKPRTKKPYVYDDKDASVLFTGPLIVMVNQFSASASEILAAALQDYERAIIVGSKSTFGKGTVQRFIDLDRAYKSNNEVKPLGNLKITMQKFYRVDGGSTQLRGVEPDIILPNNYHFIDTGEKDYENAMEWSEIEPVAFGQDVYKIPDVTQLKLRSEERVARKKDFQMILENARRLKKNREQTSLPLDYTAYNDFMDKRDEEAEKFEDLMEADVMGLEVQNISSDMLYINEDESRVERNKDWISNVKKDIYIEEVLYILKDMIELTQ